MKRLVTSVLALAALAAAGLFLAREPLSLAIMKRTLARNMTADAVRDLPDGLHAAVCGSGSPFPDPQRSGPCLAVIAGKRLFIVDSGESAARTLARMGVPAGRVEAVLLTHFHSDHIDGLGNLAMQRWVGGSARAPLPLVGPAGVEQIVAGFNQAYAQDATYRTAHHGAAVAPPSGAGMSAQPFTLPDGADSLVIIQGDGLKVTAFRVDHSPVHPAVGYRFDYKGRSIVVSGDTKPSPIVEAQARGADLLVHEALSPRLVGMIRQASLDAGLASRAKIMADITDYHTTPPQAASIASRAGAKALLLTHIVPPLPLKPLEGPFLDGARERFSGPLWIARDGDLVSLPAGGETITKTRLIR